MKPQANDPIITPNRTILPAHTSLRLSLTGFIAHASCSLPRHLAPTQDVVIPNSANPTINHQLNIHIPF